MSLIAAIVGIGANNDAANVAKENNAANNALALQIYNSDKGMAQPYVDRGNAAGDELSGFLGLGGDPAKIQAAFDTYLNSTGYQFDKSQGIDAINSDKAVSGLLASGSTLKALDKFGTGLAEQYGQQYVGDLSGVASQGLNAFGSLAGAGQNYVSGVTANNNLGAQQNENRFTANAGVINSLFNAGAQAAGNAFGQSSYGGGGAAGAATIFGG